jgi:DNA-directed RNA polymerase specialized sigma24 family protein
MRCLESLIDWLRGGPAGALSSAYKIPVQEMEDLIQDAVIAFIQKEEGIQSPKAWLIGTLRLRCLLYLRKRRTTAKAMDLYGRSLPSLTAPSLVEELLMDLDYLEQALPHRMRRLVGLTRMGLSTGDLMVALGETEANVRKLRTRSITYARKLLLSKRPQIKGCPVGKRAS